LRSLDVKRKLSLEIREATLAELDEIYKIETECFIENAFTYHQLEYCLRSPDFVTLIASVNGEAAGFITGSIEGSGKKTIGHVYTLDVKRKFRRMGVGSALLEALEKIFITRGAEKCRLEVRLDNVAAKKLYLKHGYRPKEIFEDYYGSSIDALLLEKNLKRRREACSSGCALP